MKIVDVDVEPTKTKWPVWPVQLQHPSWSLIADQCPRCSFPEAAGGYCEACGWSLPHPFKEGR